MAFALLMVSILWVVMIGLSELISDAGLTLGEIILRPFLGIIEYLYNKHDKRTNEEIQEEIRIETAPYRMQRNAQEERQRIYEKYGFK